MKFFLIFFGVFSTSIAEIFDNYDEFKAISEKSGYESVTQYAIRNGFNDFEKQFSEFKLKFSKIYNSNEEELRKFNFFNSLKAVKENLEKFSNGEVLHELAINQFSDTSESEYGLKLNESPIDTNYNILEEETQQSYQNLPENFDWREKGCVTPAKDQVVTSCGSCWAFATIASIESAYAIKDKITLDLSEQELVDCSSVGKYHNEGCNQGFSDQAFKYVIENGVVEEKVCPYVHKQNQCPNSIMKSSGKKWFIKNYKFLKFNATDEEIMSTIYNSGPVTALINSRGDDFKQYHSGIITGGPKGYPVLYNHFILVIGWGKQNNTNYWIIKNSFGENWGEKGFAKLKRGINIRSLNDFVIYPIL